MCSTVQILILNGLGSIKNYTAAFLSSFLTYFFLCLGLKLEFSSVDQVFCRMCCTKPQTNTVMRALELSFPTTRRISNQPWPVKMVLVMHMTNLKIFVLSVFSFNRLKLVSTQSIIKIKKRYSGSLCTSGSSCSKGG